jgi:hypothetical protein
MLLVTRMPVGFDSSTPGGGYQACLRESVNTMSFSVLHALHTWTLTTIEKVQENPMTGMPVASGAHTLEMCACRRRGMAAQHTSWCCNVMRGGGDDLCALTARRTALQAVLCAAAAVK